jgi:AraC-like DNA-binding protein
MEFYLQDRYSVSYNDRPFASVPEAVIVGPQSYSRARLRMSGNLEVFTIGFQPCGFHALFGINMAELVDKGLSADDVIGSKATELRDAIMAAPDFRLRVFAAEQWISDRLQHAPSFNEIARLAVMLERSGGRGRIDLLAERARLSNRQFTRRFEAQVGLTPKLFARSVRFNRVLAAKAQSPSQSWTDLAHAAGYADQAHFVRDCHAFTGDAPGKFFALWIEGQ